MSDYGEFLERKRQLGAEHGFAPVFMPDCLFPFQVPPVEWAIRKGRAMLSADCGLGKTLKELVWAENVVRHTNGRVLILTPLAVAQQTIREGDKFGIGCYRANGTADLKPGAGIAVTNYEKLHRFDHHDFAGVVCDESSCIKAFDGSRRAEVTEFLRVVPYRLMATATAAPNDYIELGTSSEALGELGHMDMLARFFRNDQSTSDSKQRFRTHGGARPKWRFKGHASEPFWRWVCSWARAYRKPSDLGFPDEGFTLPALDEREHVVETGNPLPGYLFAVPAQNLAEERQERRRTLTERCELAAQLADHKDPVVLWCHLNDEGDLLARLIPGAVQVSGADTDEAKEEAFEAFSRGQVRALVTKSRIAGWGLNWQNAAHAITFATHSYEQYYQSIRRMWRYGQKRRVVVDLVATEGERGIRDNLRRKAVAADKMFAALVQFMNDAIGVDRSTDYVRPVEVPSWLSEIR